MKKLSFILCLTLITYIFSQTADLKESQTITTGNNKEFIIEVTPAESTTITAISGQLVLSSSSSTLVDYTCTVDSNGISAKTDVTCTASFSSEGTYKLSTLSATVSGSQVSYTPGSKTMTVEAAAAAGGSLTAIKIDLKSSQTVKSGSDVEIKLSVTPTGAAIKVSEISGLELVLSTNSSEKTDITCTISSAVTCAAGSATDFTCKSTISTEGTYKLNGNDLTFTATLSDNSAISGVEPTIGTTTLTVSNTSSSTTSSSSDNSKYLNVSLCLFFILLFF